MTTARTTLITALSTVIAANVVSCNNAAQTAPTVIDEGITFCESTLPYNGGLLIANFGTAELNPLNTEGKGYIKYWKDGAVQTVIPADGNLSAPKGMFYKDGYLYICDVNKIALYSLNGEGSKFVTEIVFPEGDLFVNDLAASGDWLYASVTNSDRIFRINISDISAPGTPEQWLTIPGPNGIVIADGQMYAASYPADGNTQDKHVIYKISDLEQPAPEKIISVPGQYDGIQLSQDEAYLYITNWAPASVSRVDIARGTITPVEISLETQLAGPADMSLIGGKLYIPDLPNSRVVVIDEPAADRP